VHPLLPPPRASSPPAVSSSAQPALFQSVRDTPPRHLGRSLHHLAGPPPSKHLSALPSPCSPLPPPPSPCASAQVPGTGPGGRVTKGDVLGYLDSLGAAGPGTLGEGLAQAVPTTGAAQLRGRHALAPAAAGQPALGPPGSWRAGAWLPRLPDCLSAPGEGMKHAHARFCTGLAGCRGGYSGGGAPGSSARGAASAPPPLAPALRRVGGCGAGGGGPGAGADRCTAAWLPEGVWGARLPGSGCASTRVHAAHPVAGQGQGRLPCWVSDTCMGAPHVSLPDPQLPPGSPLPFNPRFTTLGSLPTPLCPTPAQPSTPTSITCPLPPPVPSIATHAVLMLCSCCATGHGEEHDGGGAGAALPLL
jgi:hypothetical protein